MIHPKTSIAVAALELSSLVAPAQAIDIAFTIVGVLAPPGSSHFGRIGLVGTVTGVLRGFEADMLNQRPTSIEFLSGYEPIKLSQTVYQASSINFMGAGFDLVGGSVVDVNSHMGLFDPDWGGRLLVFNRAVFATQPIFYNGLAWNGLPVSGIDDGTRYTIANRNGLGGTSYAQTSAIPEPTTAALLLAGAAVLAAIRRSRRRDLA